MNKLIDTMLDIPVNMEYYLFVIDDLYNTLIVVTLSCFINVCCFKDEAKITITNIPMCPVGYCML